MKILFLQEYIRENHMKKVDGEFQNVFLQSKAGKMLRNLAEKGLNVGREGYYIDYAYHLVPNVITRDNSGRAIKYKPPTQAEAKPEAAKLRERILKEKPDIIVPTGGLGCVALLGKGNSAISKTRGIPTKVTVSVEDAADHEVDEEKINHAETQLDRAQQALASFEKAYAGRVMDSPSLQQERSVLERQVKDRTHQLEQVKYGASNTHECWVLPMYSMEYMLVNPSIQNLVESDFVTLQKFVEQGESAFVASQVSYEFVTSIDRVRGIFTKEVPAAEVVAWDLETNTLHAELPGAKPLVISLSYKEGTGCTIPLEHKEFTWLPGHLSEIYNYIKEFVANPSIKKVGHNIQFDIRFLRLTKNFTEFANNLDTKILYYNLINQDVDSSLALTNLSYELTDMGGYDKALADYKKQFKEEKLAQVKAQISNMKEAYKARVATEKARAKAEKVPFVKPAPPEYPPAEPPRNEIDGGDFNYEWIPLESMLHPYASGDVDACLRIFNKLDSVGKKEENLRIRELYSTHYPELTDALASVEANGAKLDIDYIDQIHAAYSQEEERLLQEMRKHWQVKELENANESLYQKGLEEFAKPVKERDKAIADLRTKYKDKLVFNPNSNRDKQYVLFKCTGHTLPYNKENLVESAFTDGIPEDEIEWFHYKTNVAVCDYIIANYPETAELAKLLAEHSLVKTRRQGFTDKLKRLASPTGLIHGSLNSTGTETSRLSSNSPNLQNIPRKTGDVTRFDYHHPIKRMFISRFEGGALLQLDYSSLESRILGLAAYDEEMTEAFLEGKDLHKETATFVYGVSVDEVTDDMRSMAKAVTFGLAYGETPFSFAPKHNMTVEEAEVVFEKYFRNKPRVKEFIDETHEVVKSKGYVECLQGFRRNLRDVYSQDKSKKNAALRQSVNTKIQGSGAFLTNSSLIHINKFIQKRNLRSKVSLTVHDSIVIDCPPEEIELVAKAARFIMENLPIDWLFIDWKGERIRYPIAADVEIGLNYNDMVEYDAEEFKTFSSTKGYCKYYLDLKKVKDYKNSKAINPEKYEQLVESIEGKYEVYRGLI